GYTVMSWHCVSVRGANGDATPYFFARSLTWPRYAVVSDLVDVADSFVNPATARLNSTRAVSSRVTGTESAAPPRPPPLPPRPPPAARPQPPPGRPPRPPATFRPAAGVTSCAFASESICARHRAVSAAVGWTGASLTRAESNSARRRLFAVSSGEAACAVG